MLLRISGGRALIGHLEEDSPASGGSVSNTKTTAEERREHPTCCAEI